MIIKSTQKKIEIALAIICLGITLRVIIRTLLAGTDIANIEPILPLALLAGFILGGWYSLWVPLAMMVLSDLTLYAIGAGGFFGWNFILGITFFTWSGMMLAGYVGKALKPRMLLRMKNMAVFTGVGIVMVLIYDAWTLTGWWLVSGKPLEDILAGQVTFTIYHILSTLIFVPLFGTGYVYIKEYGMPILSDWKSKAEMPEDET
jgi:hypothetical protein